MPGRWWANQTFKLWCRRAGHWKTKETAEEITHTFMDGGVLEVPESEMESFTKAYAERILNEESIYLVERKTAPYHRFALDIDAMDESEWSLEKIKELIMIIQGVLYDFYQVDLNCIVCQTNDTKEIIFEDRILKKTGLHLHWPKLVVTDETTTLLYESILSATATAGFETTGSLRNVIDSCVTKDIGLRVIGSAKCVFCKCKNKRACDQCMNGLINKGRVYWPTMILDTQGDSREIYFERLKKDVYKLIEACSIRSYNEELTPIVRRPEYAPDLEVVARGAIRSVPKGCSVHRGNIRRYISTGSSDFNNIANYVLKTLEHSKRRSKYYNIRIRDISKWKHGEYYLIRVDSMYCQNVERDHSRCGIYFHMNEMGLAQKCFCVKDNVGVSGGPCSRYTSVRKPLDDDIRQMLFAAPLSVRKGIPNFQRLSCSDALANPTEFIEERKKALEARRELGLR